MSEIQGLKERAAVIRTRILLLVELLADAGDPRDTEEAVKFLEGQIDKLLVLVGQIDRLTRGFSAREAKAVAKAQRLDPIAEKVFGPQVRP